MPRKTLYRIVVRKNRQAHFFRWTVRVFNGSSAVFVATSQTQQGALEIGWDRLWQEAERNRPYA